MYHKCNQTETTASSHCSTSSDYFHERMGDVSSIIREIFSPIRLICEEKLLVKRKEGLVIVKLKPMFRFTAEAYSYAMMSEYMSVELPFLITSKNYEKYVPYFYIDGSCIKGGIYDKECRKIAAKDTVEIKEGGDFDNKYINAHINEAFAKIRKILCN